LKKHNKTSDDAALIEKFFGTDDLKGEFGTDDPVAILARCNPDDVSGTSAGIIGFKEEAERERAMIREARRIVEINEINRRRGSLDYLAYELGKTSRQIREYCKKGLVPGATQTAGGHWRITYQSDTVDKVRAAIGGFARRRKPKWLMQKLRAMFESDEPLPEELMLPEKLLKRARLTSEQYDFAAAAKSLVLLEKKVTVSAVAKLTGKSRPTVRKKLPDIHNARNMRVAGSALMDQHSEALHEKQTLGAKRKVPNSDYDAESCDDLRFSLRRQSARKR
jgi:hypothetical protein